MRAVGGTASATRTPEQTEVARFWSDPPFVQNQKGLRGYSDRAGLGTLATARLFALADTAAADGLIACFDAKYHYAFWRPVIGRPGGGHGREPGNRRRAVVVTAAGRHAEPPGVPERPLVRHAPPWPGVVTALGHGRLDLDLSSAADRHDPALQAVSGSS